MFLWFVTYKVGRDVGQDRPVVTGAGTVDAVKQALRDFHRNFNLGDEVDIQKAVLVGAVAYNGIAVVA
jgi:hypothetical protein